MNVAFLEMAGVPLDLAELEQQGKIMEEKLTEIVKDYEYRFLDLFKNEG